MRTWMNLVLLVSMMGVGCGSDDSSTNAEPNAPDDSGAAPGEAPDAGAKDPLLSCDRETIPKELQRYTGPMPTFSQADADKCAALCMQSEDCYSEQNCPGIDLWETCLNRNAFACSASEGKECRTEYENVECCGAAAGCKDLNCLEQKCPDEATALRDCRAADQACRMSATTACFGAGTGT